MPLATTQDACREYAWNMGAQCADRAWLLTDYDTWERNPHYHGPVVRHPEDDDEHQFTEGTMPFTWEVLSDDCPF